MLSLVICSKSPKTNSALKQNISDTIGVDYEIIHIDNSANQYNIFQAYNIGVSRSQGDILCFMHEDILYRSENWGHIVEQYFANDYIGALGVAGGHYVAKSSDWRFYGFSHVNLIQGTNTIEEDPEYYKIYSYQLSNNTPIINVSVLDGVWICIRKELFKQIRFDDVNFHDFHLYDSDICMQINKTGKGVFVCGDILLEHFSEGTFTEGFRASQKVFFEKWKDYLPMLKGCDISQVDIDNALEKSEQLFTNRMLKDAKIIELRRKIKSKKENKPHEDYTEDEISIMDNSVYQFIRGEIKNKNISNSVIKGLINRYSRQVFAKRKTAITLKFLWHRYLWK